MTCSMFSLLQNILNFSEIKFVPAFDTIFFGRPYSAKTDLYHNRRHSIDTLSTSFMRDVGIVYNAKNKCLPLIWDVSALMPSLAYQVLHVVLSSFLRCDC